MAVVIETTLGDFTVDLYVKERPRSCQNFLKLCKIKYYNLNLIHFLQKGFIAQTGDPTGSGRGGDSIFGILYGDQARYYEAEKVPRIKHRKIGSLSMVNCGDNMLGSQFFITLDSDLDYLDEQHCVFGEIVEGLEILEKLNERICDDEHRPYQDIRITHTVILDDPFPDPAGLEVPDRSPEPTKAMLDSGRIGADENIDDNEGRTMEEMEQILKEKEAKGQATILEMVGDLPDAEIAPPENVLFVCKLNPVTCDDDLEIIFSRFGKIKGCEVIRDQKTNDSLQYAFIEFEDRKACEDAYFKMDNVLIDDRRIHADFSQSVSKYKWTGKGRGVQVFEDKSSQDSSNTKNRSNAPWIRGGGGSYESKRNTGASDSRGRTSSTNVDTSKKHWSRSPPRYSRGHASEQKKSRKDEKSTDDKLIELLKKELLTKPKKKSKKRNKKSKKDSDSSSSDSDSDDSSSREDRQQHKSKSRKK